MVCHFGKYKSGNVFGLQKHNQRENKNYSNMDIDKARTPLNYDLVNQGNINYLKRVKSIIEANRTSERAIEKMQLFIVNVLYLQIVIFSKI